MADTLRVSNLSSTSGSVALTINNDQSLIGYGDHWNVGNVNGSGQSGNWSTFGANWYACSGFGTTLVSTVNYKQCCISWNGQYVLFTATNPSYGPYFSNNGGYTVATVSPDVSAAGNFYGCAMSASGQYTLVANLTTVFLSSNFLTMPLSAVYSSTAYTSVLSVTSTTNSLAMSASGQYAVFAYSASASTGGIYLSSNYGVTWALVSGTNFPWQSVSMSSSGQYITACCNGTPNNIYISSNGATFSLPSTTVSSVAGWRSVKVSSSGQYQVAAATNFVYYSSDYGMTWTASSMSSSITWGCVAVSPSGKYMIASNNAATSYMYTNSNYGAGAWTQQANGSNQYSICLAVSSTGTVAYASNGNTIIMSALTTAAAPLLAPALAMGTNPNATSNALLSVYTSNTSGVGTGGGGAIALGMNYGSPAVGVFGGVGDKLILYHGTASSYPYSIGVDTSKFYCSAPTGVSYGWIIGGTQRMTLDSSGYVGIGTATPSDSFVVNSGSIVINNSAAAHTGYLFNQNSVWGGVDIEGIANTGAQTINVGVNMNRAKAWSSSYSGLWFRIDTRTGYNGFHFFNKAVTSGTESEIMTILSNGNVGIGSVNPTQTLDVAGTIARSGMKLPRVDYGTLGTAGSITIPILFSDTQYNMVEIRVRYIVIHTVGVNINISATSTQPAALNFNECGLTTIQYKYPTAPVNSFVEGNTTSLLFASGVEQYGIEHNLLFRMTRTVNTAGYLRNHYSYDNVYCWTGIGTAQGTGRGHIDTTSTSYPIASITLTPSAGTINCVYNTTHYN